MSNSERNESHPGQASHPFEKQAFKQLERLVQHLGEELASFRKRALQAESKLKAIESFDPGEPLNPAQVAKLRKENSDLKERLSSARTRTKHMMDRVRFLRQQHQQEMGVRK